MAWQISIFLISPRVGNFQLNSKLISFVYRNINGVIHASESANLRDVRGGGLKNSASTERRRCRKGLGTTAVADHHVTCDPALVPF